MLLWIDGFDAYGTATGSAPAPSGVLARKYVSVGNEGSIQVQAGRLGGYCLKFTGFQEWFTTPALTIDATMIVGLAVKYSAWPSTGTLLAFYDGSTEGMNIRITSAGEVAVYLGGSLLATTSGSGLLTGAWSYIEFKVVCGSSGSYELRIGGVTKLSASSVNTKAGSHNYHTAFQVGETGFVTNPLQVDDVYCLDGSGSVNNTFLGNQRVVTIYPSGDAGGYTDFTCSTGSSHYTLVKENPADDDTSYVESSTTGNTDAWTYAAVSSLGAIAGIQINTQARDTDATSFTLKTLIKSASTVDVDAGQVIGSTNYTSFRRVKEADPALSSAWTVTSINAAQFGVRVG